MRTLQEIKNRILTELAAMPALAALQVGASTTSISGWQVDVTGRVLHLQEEIFATHRTEMETLKRTLIVGTDEWYVAKMLEFQYGDTIEWDPVSFQAYYPVVDESKRVIKYVAAIGYNGKTLLKLARDDNGQPASLLPAELTAARNYLRRIQVAGAQIDVSSLPADLCEVWAEVYYDGLLPVSQVQAAVELAITSYLGTLEFQGYLLRNRLIDVIQAVPGVQDVYLQTLNVASQGAIYPVGRIFSPRSGYFQVAPSAPLSSTISYIGQ